MKEKSPQQRSGAPQHRPLPVQIAGAAFALAIVLQVVLFAGAFTNTLQIVVGVEITDQAQPASAGGAAVGLAVQPAGDSTGTSFWTPACIKSFRPIA